MSRARFLIDECLSVELAGLAWQRGYQASHLRDFDLLGRKDGELAPVIFEGDWCFVTKNARDFRGPDDAKGSSGEYAGVDLHAGLVCIHGPPEGFTKAEQLEAFTVVLDLIERHGNDATTCSWRWCGLPMASPTKWRNFHPEQIEAGRSRTQLPVCGPHCVSRG